MSKRLLLIMNPYAGKKEGQRYLARILEKFCRQGYTPTVYMTTGPGNAKELAAAYGDRHDLVVSVGGDGTFNEVLAGLYAAGCTTPIGYIPCGSTNDFASSISLPKDLLKATDNILSGRVHTYDAGDFGGRLFSYVASFGAFTRVSYSTPQQTKNVLGHLAYVLEGAKDLSSLRRWHLKVECGDETFEDDYVFGAICNSTSVGGILKMNPGMVDMSDGLLELLLIKFPANAIELAECVHSLSEQKYNTGGVILRSCSSVMLHADAQMDWTLDGEREPGRDCIPVHSLPGAIHLISE